MMEKTGIRTIFARSDRPPAELIEDIAVEIVTALFPVALVGSIFLVGAPYGWAWGVTAGAGLWAVVGAIIVVCACLLSNRVDENLS